MIKFEAVEEGFKFFGFEDVLWSISHHFSYHFSFWIKGFLGQVRFAEVLP